MAWESYANEKELRESLEPGEGAVAVFMDKSVLKIGCEFLLKGGEGTKAHFLHKAMSLYKEDGFKIKVVKGRNGKH